MVTSILKCTSYYRTYPEYCDISYDMVYKSKYEKHKNITNQKVKTSSKFLDGIKGLHQIKNNK